MTRLDWAHWRPALNIMAPFNQEEPDVNKPISPAAGRVCGGLASCVIRVSQSRMTSKEQRRSRCGERTTRGGVPLCPRRLLNLRWQPRAQLCVQRIGIASIFKPEISYRAKSAPYPLRLYEPRIANQSALPSCLRAWTPPHRDACAPSPG